MALGTGNLRPFNNSEILNRIRFDASEDYRRRVPSAVQSDLRKSLDALTAYQPGWNEFTNALINRVGSVITQDVAWANPLAIFKRNTLEFGDTIEEAQIGLIQASQYKPEEDSGERELFGTARPDVQSLYHTVNRRNRYKVTVNDQLLRQAFLEPAGLQRFLNGILSAPTTSDAWDEFLMMCNLLSDYEADKGFWHTQVPDVRNLGASTADVNTFIKKVQSTAGNLAFLNPKYSASRMPTWAAADRLILLVSPETLANINVEAWAAAFNLDKAQMQAQIIQIPKDRLPDEKTQAILTTKDFFVVADQLNTVRSMENPADLSTNYWLHRWEVISASLFVPAVHFWTGADDESVKVVITNLEITSPTLRRADGTAVGGGKLKPGENAYLDYKIAGNGIPDGFNIPVEFKIAGNTSPRTRVYNDGTLIVAADETAKSFTLSGRITGGGTLKAAAGGAKAGGEFTVTVNVDTNGKNKIWPKA